MATEPKVIAVAMALKQSLEINAGAGTAINSHPNAFFLMVQGPVDLYKMAEAALARAASYEEGLKATFEAAVKAFGVKLLNEAKAGAASIEDALARLKTKAGGELTEAPGVIQEAVEKVKDTFLPAKSA